MSDNKNDTDTRFVKFPDREIPRTRLKKRHRAEGGKLSLKAWCQKMIDEGDDYGDYAKTWLANKRA